MNNLLKKQEQEIKIKSSLTLSLIGLGHVPSMKNSKMLTKGRLITDPKKQKWMQRAILSLRSQLWSEYQTTAGATSMAASQLSLTAYVPADDSFQWIPEINVKYEKVAKGEEGATITIERIE